MLVASNHHPSEPPTTVATTSSPSIFTGSSFRYWLRTEIPQKPRTGEFLSRLRLRGPALWINAPQIAIGHGHRALPDDPAVPVPEHRQQKPAQQVVAQERDPHHLLHGRKEQMKKRGVGESGRRICWSPWGVCWPPLKNTMSDLFCCWFLFGELFP